MQEHITVSYYPTKIGDSKYTGRGDIILVYHGVSKDHVIKGSCDFMSGK